MTQSGKSQDRLAATLSLTEPTTKIPGVKDSRAKSLASLGMNSVYDVLTHYPARYMDLTKVRTSATAQIGEQCTMVGTIFEIKQKRRKPRLSIIEITLLDSYGTFIVTVFNKPYLAKQLIAGQNLIVAGKTEFSYGFLRMVNPYIEIHEGGEIHGKVIPVHPAGSKLTTAHIRGIIKSALKITNGVYDILPTELRVKRGLVSRQCAFRSVHFPKTLDESEAARKRLAYEELLEMQLFMMAEENARLLDVEAFAHIIDGPKLAKLRASIPFELTDEQEIAIEDLLKSLSEDRTTSRMLLGDVGTGKTIVSAFGMASAADTGTQALMLAPTEILATQHHAGLSPLLESAGIKVGLLTGSTPKEVRQEVLEDFASGDIDVLIGTHALLEPDVVGKNISFIVIDEQQRFGVEQREVLLSKGTGADSLFMTATPIPRTLALTLFGGMGLSYIRERPNITSGRSTTVLEYKNRGKAFDNALAALKEGRQVYVVCPLIEPDKEKGEKSSEDDIEDDYISDSVLIEDEQDLENGPIASAQKEAEILQNQVFIDYKVGLLHGNLSPDEKASVMQEFRDGKIQILVSTTVIEVGVDVPNATIMIIENADRFGLSQLHQLRGRVGRGEHEGQVFLISATKHPKAINRLKAMEKSDDGFEIAQYDLSLRREGDILGNRQSGTSSLKLVNIVRDSDLVQAAHEDALEIIKDDPLLESRKYAALAREIRFVFEGEHSRIGG